MGIRETVIVTIKDGKVIREDEPKELFTEKEWVEWLDKQRENGYGWDDKPENGC